MTFAAGDCHPYCIYGGRYRTPQFPIFDTTGNGVTGAAGLDSERSIDQGTYADCTNEATEVATSSAMYYLDLTATETTGTHVAVNVKTSTSGATTARLSYPIVRLPILESGTAQAGAAGTITLASGASAKDGFYVGLYVQISNNSPANVQGMTRQIISYVGSTRVATVAANWGTNPSSASTYDILIPSTANIAAVLGQRMPDWSTAGVPSVDVANWKGTAVATPGTAGVPSVDTLRIGGTVQTAYDLGAGVKIATGTAAGQLDITSGVVKASLVQILGTALTETSGQIAAAFKKFFDKASPTGTVNSLPDAVAGAAGGVFIAGTNAATTITTALTTTFTGNLTGSVDSVTGLTASNLDATISSRLAPTVAGRTLDITATGEAGIDWANIGGPTTTVALTGTTVGTATNLTNAPTSGDLTATMKTSVTTAATAATPTAAAVTGNVGGSVATVTALAANSITASALAADAVDEILDEPVEGSITFRQALRAFLSVLAGKVSGAGTGTIVFRDANDTKNRVTADDDGVGNRTSVTLDLT